MGATAITKDSTIATTASWILDLLLDSLDCTSALCTTSTIFFLLLILVALVEKRLNEWMELLLFVVLIMLCSNNWTSGPFFISVLLLIWTWRLDHFDCYSEFLTMLYFDVCFFCVWSVRLKPKNWSKKPKLKLSISEFFANRSVASLWKPKFSQTERPGSPTLTDRWCIHKCPENMFKCITLFFITQYNWTLTTHHTMSIHMQTLLI